MTRASLIINDTNEQLERETEVEAKGRIFPNCVMLDYYSIVYQRDTLDTDRTNTIAE
jgi:hypothetical protein